MKVLLIDPWGTNNTSEYLNGLIIGLNKYVDLTVYTNKYFIEKKKFSCEVRKKFFKYSEKMQSGKFRKFVRGIEYIRGYIDIMILQTKARFDIIHINWLLCYKIDIRLLIILKKISNQIVYTAHNVIPHINGEKEICKLREIYKICDAVIVHGEEAGKEFKKYFDEFSDKLYIQNHGSNIDYDISYDIDKVEEKLKRKLNSYYNKYICFGNIFFNKGFDRVMSMWKPEWEQELLIIAGNYEEKYNELEIEIGKKKNNILFIGNYVDNNTLNYLITSSSLIILPYRHASMSGIVFTAADFHKTILSTDVGCIKEYVENGKEGFIIENTDEALEQAINGVKDIEKEKLTQMGDRLSEQIKKRYNWETIGGKIVKECYNKSTMYNADVHKQE